MKLLYLAKKSAAEDPFSGYKNGRRIVYAFRSKFTSDVQCLTFKLRIFKQTTDGQTSVSLNLTDDFIQHPASVCPASKDNTVICNSLASYATVLIVATRDKWRAAIPSSTIYASTGAIAPSPACITDDASRELSKLSNGIINRSSRDRQTAGQ